MEIILLVAGILILGFLYGRLLLVIQPKQNLMMQGLEKADRDRSDWVRIPYNQVVEVFGIEARHGLRRDRLRRNEGLKHPALMSPARRRKL